MSDFTDALKHLGSSTEQVGIQTPTSDFAEALKGAQGFNVAPESKSLGQELLDTGSDFISAMKNIPAIADTVAGSLASDVGGFVKGYRAGQLAKHPELGSSGLAIYTPEGIAEQDTKIAMGEWQKEKALGKIAPKSYLGKIAQSVTVSMGYQMPTMALSLIAPQVGIPLMVASFGPTTYGNKYNERITQGFDHESAHSSALKHAALEVGFEAAAAPLMLSTLKALKAGKGVLTPFVKEQLGEQFSEIATTFGQRSEDSSMGQGPSGETGLAGITADMFTPEMGRAIVDTVVATAMQGAITGTAMYPLYQGYKKDALETGKLLQSMIADAKVAGLSEVTIGNQTLSISELETKLEAIKEAYNFKASDLPVPVMEGNESGVAPNAEAINPAASGGTSTLTPSVTEVDDEVGSTLADLASVSDDNTSPITGKKKTASEQLIFDTLNNDKIDDATKVVTLEAALTKLNPNNKSHRTAYLRLKEEIAILKGETPNERENGQSQQGSDEGSNGLPLNEVQNAPQERNESLPNVQAGNEGGVSNPQIAGATPAPVVLTQPVTKLQEFLNDTSKNVHSDGSLDSRLTGVVGELVRKLGITNKIVFTSTSSPDFNNLANEVTEIRGSNVTPTMKGFGRVSSFVNPNKSERAYLVQINKENIASLEGLSSVMQLEVLMHEALGHIAIAEKFHSAPTEIKAALEVDFKRFMTERLGTGDYQNAWKEFMVVQFGSEFVNLNATDFDNTVVPGTKIGEEWLANNIVKALLAHDTTHHILAKWWSSVAKEITRIYQAFSDNKLDTITGVQSAKDFVEFMFRSAEESNLSVENFNTKGMVQSIYEHLFEVDSNGKRTLKAVPKLGHASGKGEVALVSKKEVTESGLRIKEVKLRGTEATKITVDMKGPEGGQFEYSVDGQGYTGQAYQVIDKHGLVLTTLPWSKYPKNVSWEMAKYIRDMIVLAKSNQGVTSPISYETGKVGKIKFKIRNIASSSELLKRVAEEVERVAKEGNISEKAALGRVIQGSTHAERYDADGKINRWGERYAKVFKKWLALNPSEGEELRSLAVEPQVSVEARKVENVLADERVAGRESVNSFIEGIESQVRQLIDDANGNSWMPNKGSENLSAIKELVTLRFEHEGKDYYRTAPEVRNVVTAEVRRYRDFLVGNKNTKKFMEDKDIRVYHGTSKVISDVPTMANADLNALYGPGIYTTEDHVDAETGHLVVTAGYAGVPNVIWKDAGARKRLIPVLKDLLTAEGKNDRRNIESALLELDGGFDADAADILSYLGTTANKLDTAEYFKNESPNILPLEIDPAPTKEDTFDVDGEVYKARMSQRLWKATTDPWTTRRFLWGNEVYGALIEGGVNAYTNTLREEFGNNEDVKRLSAYDSVKAAVNDILRMEGFNFITHKGGGITGGVSHQVWIALKDGLVKSAFTSSATSNIPEDLNLTNEDIVELGRDLDFAASKNINFKSTQSVVQPINLAQGGESYAEPSTVYTSPVRKNSWATSIFDEIKGLQLGDSFRGWFEGKRGEEVGGVRVGEFQIEELVKSLRDVGHVVTNPVELFKAVHIEVAKEDKDLAAPRKRKTKAPQRINEGEDARIFKKPVDEKKVKRKAKTQLEYDAAAEKKKDADRLFLESFSKLVDKATAKGMSLTEYMDTLPIPDKNGNVITDVGERRKVTSQWWARWMRLTSMVSQNEAIYRLSQVVGIVNIEDGTQNISTFVKSIWPKHSGELSHLDTLGKEIVIDRLQKIIEKRFGERYDFEKEPSFADLNTTNADQFDKLPWYKKTARGLWMLQARTEDTLTKTPAGAMLVDRLKRVLMHSTLYQRDYKRSLRDLLKAYPTEASRHELYLMLVGEIPTKNSQDEAAVQLMKSIGETYSLEMERTGVKIWFKNGKYELYKHKPGEVYYPHMWKEGAFTNPTEDMIKSVMTDLGLIDSKISRQVAEKYIRNYGRRYQRIYSQKFANMEMARETNLGGFITDPIEVFTKYVDRASKRLALVREFGHDTNRVLTFYALEHYRQSNADPDAMKNATYTISGITGIIPLDIAREFKGIQNHTTLLASSLMLQHAFLVQPGIVSNVVGMVGFKNTIKGFAEILPGLTSKEGRETAKHWSRLIGADAFTLSRELFDSIQDDKTREKTDRMMRYMGITGVDTWMRLGTALVGRLAIRDAIVKANSTNVRDSVKAKRFLASLHLDSERIARGEFTEEDVEMGSLSIVEQTNFVSDVLTSPVVLKNNPWGRILTLFTKFAFQQHHFMKGLIKRDKGGALKQLLAGTGVGVLIFIARTLAKGDDPEKVLKANPVALSMWRIYSAGGGLGLFAEMLVNSLVMGRQSSTAVGGLATSTVQGLTSTLDWVAGEGDQNDAHNIMLNLIKGLQVVGAESPHPVGQAAAAGLGLTRPMMERALFPSERQEETSLFNN